MPENPIDFRAPPPSPIASGRRSSVANDDVLTEFLEHSLRVPDLVLPDKIFPRQKIVETPPRIDFQSLHSADTGIFRVPPEKRVGCDKVLEKPYGFEEVHGEEESELSEEFVWCRDEKLKVDMEEIHAAGYSNFSEKMETLVSDMENVAEKILQVLRENSQKKTTYGEDIMQGLDLVGSVCYLYKHKHDHRANSLGYDVIRMLIRGIDYSHALCLHICDGSSEFHVYSKKGWVSFSPDKDAIVVTVGDQTQMVELENTYKEIGEESLNPDFCQRLATSFSFTPNRAGKPAITWKQVQSWFEDRQKESQSKVNPSPVALKLFVDLSDASISSDASETYRKSKVNRVTDLSDLTFEAKSARDHAWYDVAAFLSYRVLCTGELEARIRFAGFRNTDDEWVNVKRAVRERSIPLEPSECSRVKVGDLVLCFRERQELAVYCDAYVMGIQREPHDARDCGCVFVVRYDYDFMEERFSGRGYVADQLNKFLGQLVKIKKPYSR
ncbi:hypothetical protein GH714_020601 [Hevea brasiliensis]|uniref:SAWADEE domain-containing protein n=1 Tax=Hevea brasiliensis TaxID=3981 RepID=A0A6A6LLL7_HEVBR|nr:hypothetical protein GH714_020601 [Hevea brasiliensis]